MTTHSQHNNVEAATAASDHNKRVSFGAEEHVQMIVYDDGINDDYSIGQNNRHHQQQQTARHTFTEPDAPPSRVRVHAEQAEVPRPISPPAQLAPVMMDMTAAHSSTSSGGGNNAISASAPALQMINSPPLPSFARREDNSDNPFRPDEQLYHEVDPIVEMYRQRPFPPSPTHSPVPPHQQQQQQQTPSRTTPSRSGVANGGGSAGGGGGGRHSSLAEARREANQTHPAELADSAAAADGLLGPPGRAEVVRMPEKKKRACCSLQ